MSRTHSAGARRPLAFAGAAAAPAPGETIGPGLQTFDLPWEPVAWKRPRARVFGGRAHMFTDRGQRNDIAAIRYLLSEKGARIYQARLPLELRVEFRVKRPKSAPKRVVHPVTRPDVDQYAKAILDAATGILWEDDAQVVRLTATKVYDASGGASIRLEVEPSNQGSGRAR